MDNLFRKENNNLTSQSSKPRLCGKTVCPSVAVVIGHGERVSLWCGAVGFGAGMSSLFAAAVAQLHGLVSGGISGRAGGGVLS
jgi:hypothetical protein